MTRRKIDILSSLILISLAIYVIKEAMSMPAQYGALGPGFFPKLLGGSLAAFAIAILAFALFDKKSGAEPVPAPRGGMLLIMLATAVFLGMLPYLGFLITMPCYLTVSGLLIAGDIRNFYKQIIISSIISTVALYLLFSLLLNVPLP